MGNQKLLDLYERFYMAQASIDAADMTIHVLQSKLAKAKRGHDDYAKNTGIVTPSFLIMHRNIYNDAESRYKNALAFRAKAAQSLERVCQELRQYAIDHCVPEKYRKTATAKYVRFSNFISISYCVDEVSKDFVVLKLYISGNGL